MKKVLIIFLASTLSLSFVFAQDINSLKNNKSTTEKKQIIDYVKKIIEDEKIAEKIAERIVENPEESIPITQEEKIEQDVKTFEQEVREFFIDPSPNQFGLGIFFGSILNGVLINEVSEGSFPHMIMNLGLGISYTKSDINNKFGFRWNFNIGGSPAILPLLHLGTDFNWIFLKLRFDSSHTRTTHILDLMLGLGLNADLGFSFGTYFIDPFLQLGLSFSFYNHWTIFAVGGLGSNFVFSRYPFSNTSSYYGFSKIGIRYNF